MDAIFARLFAAVPSIASFPTPRRPFGLAALLGLLLLVAGCSEFNRALKTTDLDMKLRVATKFYEAGKWEKAIPLLEELVALTRGSSLSERVMHMHAKSYFGMKDYTLAGYYLNNFTRTFPTSALSEECAFLSAYCHFKNSPNYELDQTDTKAAIDALQLFLVRYPNTSLKDSCNNLIDGLRYKLELKDFTGAKQYHKLRNYQAAVVALEQFQRQWPNSRYREEAHFLSLESAYLLAINSVESRKMERVKDAIRLSNTFADAFPASSRSTEAQRMAVTLNVELERILQASSP